LTVLPDNLSNLERLTGDHRSRLRYNQLVDPPQGVANWGWAAVFSYRGIPVAPEHSITRFQRFLITTFNPPGINKKKNVEAILQTIVISAVSLALSLTNYSSAFWLVVVVSPIFMIRTEISVQKGLEFFKRVMGGLRIKNDDFMIPSQLFLSLLSAGILALAIKLLASISYGLIHPIRVLQQLPNNYLFYFTRCSLFDLPELLPNMEKSYLSEPDHYLSIYDLGMDFTDRDTWGTDVDSAIRMKMALMGIGIFFVLALCFRITIKAAALFYAIPVYIFLRGRLHPNSNYQTNSETVERTNISPLKPMVSGVTLLFVTCLIIFPELINFKSLFEEINFINVSRAEQIIAPHITDFVEFCLRPTMLGLPLMVLPLAIAWIFFLVDSFKKGVIKNPDMTAPIDKLLDFLDKSGFLVLGIYLTVIGLQLFELLPYLLGHIPIFNWLF